MVRLIICLFVVAVFTPAVLPEPALPSSPLSPAAGTQLAGEGTVPTDAAGEEPPEGYYAFLESPHATPPRVRPPPYRQSGAECAEVNDPRPHVSAHNLCGDLNRGLIPRNPMGHYPAGEPYPFELIRNHTLRFLSRTLPVLRADDTLPRVAHLAHTPATQDHEPDLHNRLEERSKRSVDQRPDAESNLDEVPSHRLRAEHRDAEAPRESRKFCDGGGVFCMLYRAINGESAPVGGVERREDPGPAHAPHAPHNMPRYEGPPTPCPARVEYATPVFARNYQGVWRYVVQIPYEGYFTQTVEVTRCMQARCHYLEGGCLSSPRWVSLLVAELHYPQEYQPQAQSPPQQAGASAAATPTDTPPHCDGHDELGCFQVRLYYDWFLVPGSCKCWRPDYFARYVRRRHSSNEL